jgi:hypothetical protein
MRLRALVSAPVLNNASTSCENLLFGFNPAQFVVFIFFQKIIDPFNPGISHWLTTGEFAQKQNKNQVPCT